MVDPEATAGPEHGVVLRLALSCAAVVAALFGAYELLEGTALAGASPVLLHGLHLARGVGSSALVGLMVGWYLLHRTLPNGGGARRDPRDTLRESNTWFVAARWVAAVAALAATLAAGPLLGVIGPGAVPRLLAAVLALGLANLGWTWLLRRGGRPDRLLLLQAFVDLGVLTAMLHWSGGLENPAHTFYLFHIVIAAVLLPPLHAWGVAGVAGALLVLLAGLDQAGMGTHPLQLGAGAWGDPRVVTSARAGAAVLLFGVTSHFAVLMAERLRRREADVRASAGEIETAHRQLALVADSLDAGLLLWTRDGSASWCNSRAKHLGGCADRPAPGEACTSCVHKDAGVADGFRGEVPGEREVVEAGSVLRVRVIPVRNDAGDVENVLQVVEDVTARKALEAEALHGARMAILGRVSAAMAHEIGNPLASMSTRLMLLEQDGPTPYVQESARVLQQQVERIHRLVQSVRRFGRPVREARVEIDLGEALTEVVRLVGLDPRARQVSIELRVAAGLPFVEGVRDHLLQVFVNIALNALEAMPHGGTLSVVAESGPAFARVRFGDTGAGLVPEARANLFRPFFTTKPDGSGLGLFLSHKIVCEHGGELLAHDRPTGGAEFEIVLPLPRSAPRAAAGDA